MAIALFLWWLPLLVILFLTAHQDLICVQIWKSIETWEILLETEVTVDIALITACQEGGQVVNVEIFTKCEASSIDTI